MPVPGSDPLRRGSLSLALEVASNPDKREEAMLAFEALVYAPGSVASKNALFTTWVKICQSRNVQPLPLTPDLIRMNAAILRSAGYKAVKSFIFEAKDRHSRAGYPWDGTLQVALQDAKRVADRAVGDAKRSEEVKPEQWLSLIEHKGIHPDSEKVATAAPRTGVLTWVIGSAFLLREVELCALICCEEVIRIDRIQKVVTIALPVSKTDPKGRGALRSLGCKCKDNRDWYCAYHAVVDVVESQCKDIGASI